MGFGLSWSMEQSEYLCILLIRTRLWINNITLDTPCKAGARSLNFFEVQVVGQYIAKYITTSLSWPACRPSLLIHEPRTSHDVLLEPRASYSVFAGVRPDLSENVFSSFEKKAPNRLQKRVRNGSPSVPLLRLKARFWRFFFSFFQILENPCLKLPSVLSNVHPPIYQSQKSIISRTH